MARVRDILYRFRPAGSPGAAGAAGVPVDRAADLLLELEPLFVQLTDTEAVCDAIVEEARGAAAARHDRDQEAARVLLAAARREAAIEEATAATSARRAGDPELASIRARAEGEAQELRERAVERLPACVAQVVAIVRSVGAPSSTDGRGVA